MSCFSCRQDILPQINEISVMTQLLHKFVEVFINCFLYLFLKELENFITRGGLYLFHYWDHHGRMVVGFTTTYAISAYHY